LAEFSRPRLLTPAQLLQEQDGGALVLDTRGAEQFASLHTRGAMQIGLAGRFASWAAILIRPTQRLLLVVDNAQAAWEAHNRLARVGLRRVVGYIVADPKRWSESGIRVASVSIRRCEDLLRSWPLQPSLQLIDVRSRAEWLTGHLPGAVCLPLPDLGLQIPILPPLPQSLVYCREGSRATTAASLLLRENLGDIGILIDGVGGWSTLGLPLLAPYDDAPGDGTPESPPAAVS
jgi:rhodanese-related sulfurtransferase